MDTIIQKRVERLLLFNGGKQRSDEWYKTRHSMVTASDISAIFDVNPYVTKYDLLRKKCGELTEFETNKFTEWGEMFEPIAQGIYQQLFGISNIYETGCIPHSKYNFIGASPDGITPNGRLLEIKCPLTRSIRENTVPHVYWIQMQIQMEVCNLNECDFFQCKFETYSSESEYKADTTSKYKGVLGDVYWRLSKWTLKTISRDTRWFIKHVGLIKRFWDMVLHYRRVGIEQLTALDDGFGFHDWSEWISASQLRNHLMGDPCLDYIDMLVRMNKKNATSVKVDDDIILMDCVSRSTGDGGRGTGNTFMEMICKQGIDFEYDVVELLKRKHRVRKITLDACQAQSTMKYKETIECMKSGCPIIYHGVVRNESTKTYGVPDLLVRSDYVNKLVGVPVLSDDIATTSSSLTTGYHYVVVDINYVTLKFCADGVHLVNSGLMKATKGQLYVYNEALGFMQGYVPTVSCIIGKRWRYRCVGVSYSGSGCFERLGVVDFRGRDIEFVNNVDKAIKWKREIIKNFESYTLFPPSDFRLYPNMCNTYDHPYHDVKKRMSKQLNEITDIWYCNTFHRLTAFHNGITNWRDERCTTQMLGITNGYRQRRIQAILDINRQTDDVVRCLNFKNASDWGCEQFMDMYVDFETVNLHRSEITGDTIESSDDTIIAMIGVGWVENEVWMFKKITVHELSYDEERRIIDEFYGFLDMLKSTCGVEKQRMFHWGHVERTLLQSARERHNGYGWYELRWVDLCKILQDEIVVFQGALNYNLKEVASSLYNRRYIGTYWDIDSDCVNGLDAMVSMIQCNEYAVEHNIPLNSMTVIKDIERYNEIDCKVMVDILTIIRDECGTEYMNVV